MADNNSDSPCTCQGRPCYNCSTAGGNSDHPHNFSVGAILGYD